MPRVIKKPKTIVCKGCGEKKTLMARGLCNTCYQREWRQNTRENNPGYFQNRHLLERYGITLVEYDEILTAQDNGCWICGKTPEENGKRLSVDHNHETGKVRGLLCYNCNVLIGYAQDNPQLLSRAIEYLSVFGE